MRTQIAGHKDVKIWIDENGQFWTGEADSKRFWNPGTSIATIKEEIDFIEAYDKAMPVKVMRIEFPYLQVWNIRKVTRKRYGFERTGWYTKDDAFRGPDYEQYPREVTLYLDMMEYDEAVYLECERRFKEIREHYDRFDQIREAMRLEEK
jgi:hypothetical protein